MDFDIRELRVGYHICVHDQFVEVIAIDNNFIKIINAQNQVSYIDIDSVHIAPIPLTLSTLSRFYGFNEKGIFRFEIDKRAFFFKINENHIILYTEAGLALIHFWEVKYLHRLEKVYYGLTGKKLQAIVNILNCF